MYHCPYCDSTNLRKFIFTYRCAKGNKKCPFERQDGKRAEELPFGERKEACELCGYKGEAITNYKCVDCDRTFSSPVEDINEIPKPKNESNNQIVFTLKQYNNTEEPDEDANTDNSDDNDDNNDDD